MFCFSNLLKWFLDYFVINFFISFRLKISIILVKSACFFGCRKKMTIIFFSSYQFHAHNYSSRLDLIFFSKFIFLARKSHIFFWNGFTVFHFPNGHSRIFPLNSRYCRWVYPTPVTYFLIIASNLVVVPKMYWAK